MACPDLCYSHQQVECGGRLGKHLEENGFLYAFGSVEPARHDNLREPLAASFDRSRTVRRSRMVGRTNRRLDCSIPLCVAGSPSFRQWPDRVHRPFLDELRQLSGIPNHGVRSGEHYDAIRASSHRPLVAPGRIYAPPEKNRPRVFIYAAKAHPELTGADLVLTYVTNSSELGDVIHDQTLYYPRFVRLRFR